MNVLVILLLFIGLIWAEDQTKIPEGKIDSPFIACQKKIIVDQSDFDKNKEEWNKYTENCKDDLITIDNFSVANLASIQTGVQFYDLLTSVAKKVNDNLEKSRKYADCTASCFSGAKSCPSDQSPDQKEVNCTERKEEVRKGLNRHSRRLRIELALAKDGPGLVDVNVANVLKVKEDKLINSELSDFEIGMPNPVRDTKLTDPEMKEAKRRLKLEREELDKEFKANGYGKYHDWMSQKMMKRFEKHQERYRQIVYEEAPILAVIDPAKQFDKLNNPLWTDKQVAEAFKKLSENSVKTKEKVDWSLESGKLEFTRYDGEAFAQWAGSMVPGKTEHLDLLYYIGMTNQVEEILKEDPSKCGVATALYNRLQARGIQNAGLGLTASLATLGASGVVAKGVGSVFRVGRALSGSEAAGLTGLAIGSVYLGDSIHQYNTATTEATTRSGLNGNEGTVLGSGQKVNDALNNVKISAALAPLDMAGAWGAGKVFYSTVAKKLEQDIPEFAVLTKDSKYSEAEREHLIDKWLQLRIQNSLKNGVLASDEEKFLRSVEGRNIMISLILNLEKSKIDLSDAPKELNFLFQRDGNRPFRFTLKSLLQLGDKILQGPLHTSQKIHSPLKNIQGRKVDDIEDRLKMGKITEAKRLNSGVSSTTLIKLEDGSRGIWKPHEAVWHSNYRAEVLAYELDRKFGFNLVPPTVERSIDGKIGSVQLFKDSTSSKDSFKNNPVTQIEIKKQSLFDFLINNKDREEENFLISSEGRVISIDNGMSFTGKGFHGVNFKKREADIIDFLRTEEGRQIVENLRSGQSPEFRAELVDYLGVNDALSLDLRISKIIKLYDSLSLKK